MEVSGQLHASAALPTGQDPYTQRIGRWVGPRADLEVMEKSRSPMPGIETQFIGHTARSPSLYQLSYPGYLNVIASLEFQLLYSSE
jgi:hypothetical protein